MKILIIDDDLAINNFLAKGLAREAWLIETAADGAKGLEMALRGGYGLIILDNSLPKVAGPEIIRRLRSSGCEIPIIMLTVKAEISNKKEAYILGADDYLTKPFLLDELILRIKALLRRPAALKAEDRRLADLNYNEAGSCFRRGRRELYLTRREYNLLHYLWRRQGEVVTRGEILEHVWQYNADPNSNSLETHIASLRKKINAGGRRELIHTFPGRGYKLAAKKLS